MGRREGRREETDRFEGEIPGEEVDRLVRAVSLPSALRASRRAQWSTDALAALADAEVVFMDPDNGFPGKSAKATSTSGPKYVFADEPVPYIERGA